MCYSCLQSTSRNKTRVNLLQKQDNFDYKVKIINPKKKSLYRMMSLPQDNQFATLSDLRKCVKEAVGEIQGTIGYIEPGHGAKGKMRQLNDDEDLSEMFVLHRRRHDVLLWIYDDTEGSSSDELSQPCKRPRTDPPAPTSKRESIAKTISNVETIIRKLKEKHGENG